MSTQLLAILLIILLMLFFIAEPLATNVFQASDVRILGVSLLGEEVHTVLGIAIAICELGIVMFSMLGRIRDTIDDLLRPLLRFVPLAGFFYAFFDTFRPILSRFFPGLFGSPDPNTSIAQAISQDTFSEGVLLTVGALVLFLMTNRFLKTPERTVRYIEKPE
jgi:hypothetical protein